MGVKMRKLKIQYTIFVMLICIAFGSIVLTEKLRPIRNDDIDKKLQVYIEENYKDLKDITTEDTYYANLKYNKKVMNKNPSMKILFQRLECVLPLPTKSLL